MAKHKDKKRTRKIKRKIRKKIKAIILFIGSVVAVILTILQIHDWVEKNKKIDTDKDSFRWKESITETISAGDTLIFPICFFPDKSCTMEFRVLFEIVNDGEKYYIDTPLTPISFAVSSFPGYSIEINNPINNKKDIDLEDSLIISYPYNDATIIH